MRSLMLVLLTGLASPAAWTWADEPPKTWEFHGQVQAATTAQVRSRVTGYVTRVAVRDGDIVEKGDLLLEIDPRPYQLALQAAKARVAVAEAQFTAAHLKAAQTQQLAEKRLVSEREMALSRAEQAEAEASLTIAKVELERAELTLSWTHPTAPFPGRVSRVRVAAGDLVAADETQILTVLATDPVHIGFNVPESLFMRWRQEGLMAPEDFKVAVQLSGDEDFSRVAKLELISPEVTSATQTLSFRAASPNAEDLLRPGMAVRVRIAPAGPVARVENHPGAKRPQ